MKQINKQQIGVFFIILALSGVLFTSCNTKQSEEKSEAAKLNTLVDLSQKNVLLATDYVMDKENSQMQWHSSLFGEEGHGTIDFARGQIGMGGGEVLGGTFKIDMKSVTSNAQLVDKLKSDDFFYVEAHPEAELEILSVKPIKGEDWQSVEGLTPTHIVEASLTLRGIEKNITFPAMIEIKGDEVITKTNQLIIDPEKWGVEYSEIADIQTDGSKEKMRIAFTITANRV